jgi:outer membrane protein insertion porin family
MRSTCASGTRSDGQIEPARRLEPARAHDRAVTRFALGIVAFTCLCGSAATTAQEPAPMVVDVRVEQEGKPVTDGLITGLVETKAGEPLSMRDVRETLTHLIALNRFEDVQVFQEPQGAGLRLRYVLFPVHAVDRIEFRGQLGLAEGEVRRVVTERYGTAPPAGRADEVAQALQTYYRDKGFVQARITAGVEESHNPDRASMVLEVQSGARALIKEIVLDSLGDRPLTETLNELDISNGQAYDVEMIEQELERHANGLRQRGYYEARIMQSVRFDAQGAAVLTITVDRGPLVSVAFTGDPLPADQLDRLVPVRVEGSVDEDLLEDSNRAIEEYLYAGGYRDAVVDYVREESEGALRVTFVVSRGPRYLVDALEIAGDSAMSTSELLQVLTLKSGEPFVQERLDTAVEAIREAYRARGFTRAVIQPVASVLPQGQGEPVRNDRNVRIEVRVTEGPRATVGSIVFEGNQALSESDLLALMETAPGGVYSEVNIASDRDRIDLEYRNRGYDAVVVDPEATLAPDGTLAEVRIAISEGPQAVIDQVIVIGNERTSTATIERELTLKPGLPFGYTARLESQQRLNALGLFRRVTITDMRHPGESRRDVLVQVEEAPPTTLDYGGGVEGGMRLRPTGPGGQAEERFEIAPRGFFGVGRRNLWGKNRSMTIFSRVSLRSRDIVLSPTGERFDAPAEGSGYGFNEYRVLATYREPRAFGTRADVLVTGILEQAIRSSFNFNTREMRAEAGLRLSPRYSLAGRYSFERTKLFDERFTDAEKPLIDRLFPQVRLSKFSTSFIRDTRDDLLEPRGGTLAVLDGELAARAFGSEVGFVKTYLQAFSYHQLPSTRQMIVALGARVGMAHGFKLDVAGQQPIDAALAPDLPASERFFAGGDTTVRGFSLDRLGTPETISPSGFPAGGNGVIVLNSELRVAVIRAIQAVGFLDAGNVFARAADLNLFDLRGAAGFGLLYGSPVGPVRVDLGFKLDRRELSPGRLERRSVLHISLGHPF